MEHINSYDMLDKYLKKINLVDYYITKNICQLVEDEKSLNFIISNPMLLGVVNKSNKNSLIILLENKKYEIIIDLIKMNNNLLKFKNYNENTLFNILLQHDSLYDFINDIILEYDIYLVIELLTCRNKEKITFINMTMTLLNECECKNMNMTGYNKIIKIFKSIMNLNKEKNILLITTICKEINDEKVRFNILNEILNRTKKIRFCNFENIIVFDYVEMNDFNNDIINIILKIIEKSNICNFKNKNNENLLEILIKYNKIDTSKLKKYFKLFNFSKQKNIKIIERKSINLKSILTRVELNNFTSNPMSNMLYTLHILKKYNNVTIPYHIKSKDEIIQDNLLMELSNMDYLLINYLKIYSDDYNTFTPYLMIWKNKWNYYVDKNLINFLKKKTNKRFVLIKLSIILLENSNIRNKK